MPQFGVVGTLDGRMTASASKHRPQRGSNSCVQLLVADADPTSQRRQRRPITLDLSQTRTETCCAYGETKTSDPWRRADAYSFQINVVPYWEWNGEHSVEGQRLPGHNRQRTRLWTRSPMTTASSINFGDTAELRFFNVTKEHFNVYVDVNGTNVISEPSTSDLGSSFTVNLDAGDNLIRIRLAAKGGQPTRRSLRLRLVLLQGGRRTDVLVSNLGQSGVSHNT